MGNIKCVLNKVCLLLITLLAVILPAITYAQTATDCNDQNNPFDTPCPLDTWVIVLVIIAGVFACAHLYQKQKSSRA
jgi:hypothetical protein